MLLPQNSHHSHGPVFGPLANMLIMKGTRNQSKMEDLTARVRATVWIMCCGSPPQLLDNRFFINFYESMKDNIEAENF
jgi:hypothetical protein